MLGNQLSDVLSRVKSTNHCQTWTWWHARFFAKWRFQLRTPKKQNWEMFTPKSEMKSRRIICRYIYIYIYICIYTFQILHPLTSSRSVFRGGFRVSVTVTVESSRFQTRPCRLSASLHPFGRWGCHLGIYQMGGWQNPEVVKRPAWFAYVYRYYVYFAIQTHHMKVQKICVYPMLHYTTSTSATSANLQSWKVCSCSQSFHAQKRDKHGLKIRWWLSGLSIKNWKSSSWGTSHDFSHFNCIETKLPKPPSRDVFLSKAVLSIIGNCTTLLRVGRRQLKNT